MAKVEWSTGIDHVSGALSKPSKSGQHSCTKMLLGTHRTAPTTSSDCNRLYLRKQTKRSTPVTAEELAQRLRFKTVAAAVVARSKNLATISQDREDFLEQREEANGAKTLKAYFWRKELESYDASH